MLRNSYILIKKYFYEFLCDGVSGKALAMDYLCPVHNLPTKTSVVCTIPWSSKKYEMVVTDQNMLLLSAFVCMWLTMPLTDVRI